MSPESDLPDINSSKVTERINATALKLLEEHPEGLRWTDLRKKIEESDPGFHPKTVNGCVWKLVEKFPDLRGALSFARTRFRSMNSVS